jgi:glutamyl/glutaminyl-tRNA synthetase
MTIRTRFAPSPTGFLHIGGVRTALFNWLLSRNLGGQFILRIDDTDAERNRTEALLPIIDGFRWLGIGWDEGPTPDGTSSTGPHTPYFQSQRNETYVAAAMTLLASGHAYPDYMTKEELDADRKRAQDAKKPYIHRGPLRDNDPADNVRRYKEKPAPLRLKIPAEQLIVVDDLVCGRCEQRADLVGDPVILRAPNVDGVSGALYNFASVIDDISFGITHILRAREHLSNTYVQVVVFGALGATLPRFGHVPVVNWKGEKMSKRKLPPLTGDERAKLRLLGWTEPQIESSGLNLATVSYYRELGYLPEALLNYLVRLCWSLDDKTEIIPLKTLLQVFNMETGVGRLTDSPAEFDPKKLFWVQDEYMKLVPLDEKVRECLPFLIRAKMIPENPDAATLELVHKVVAASAERIKLYSDILQYGAPIFLAEPEFNAKAVEKHLKKAGAAELLREFAAVLASTDPFDAPTTDKALQDFCTMKGLKPKDLVQPLRVATCGVEVGFGLFDTLAILGKPTVVARIEKALANIQ